MHFSSSTFSLFIACLLHLLRSFVPCCQEVPIETSSWTQPTGVPKCVISHLEILTFGRYQDYADEHEFVAYILERGLVLKTMEIRSHDMDLKKKHDVLKRLSLMPRGSNICQLEFFWTVFIYGLNSDHLCSMWLTESRLSRIVWDCMFSL